MRKKIVELYSLEIDDMQILVGTDVITRELYFYTEKNEKIIPVSAEVKSKILSKESDSSIVPAEIKQFIDNAGKKHLNYNSSYGFSNSALQSNLQNLNVKCEECDFQESSASYEAFSNTINIKVPKDCLEKSSINWQYNIILQQIIAHEIGHLSVSEIKLDNKGNVIVTTGFLQVKIPISESFQTIEGDDYYRLDNSKKIDENEGRGLEELLNVLEVDEVTNSAISPDFAHKLDRVTEGKLRTMRRSHSLEDYYEIMESIVSSYDKAKLLLLGLGAYFKAINENDKELCDQLSGMIGQIVDDYEIRFLSSKPKMK